MGSLLMIFNALVDIVFFLVIAQVVLSWLVVFDVINLRQPLIRQIWDGLNRLLEPLFRPIRQILPDMGGIDLAPMVFLFGLWALQVVVNRNLAPMAF